MQEILHSKIIGAHQKHILILHGIFGMGDNWNAIGKQLSNYFTVHILDVRNHGKSFHSSEMNYPAMAIDVISYLKSHSIKETAIIGHSMGGKITMQALVDFPEYFNKAVIIDISPKEYLPQHNEVINSLRTLNLSSISKRSEIDDHLKKTIKELGVRMWLMKSIYAEEGLYKFRFNIGAILNNYDLLSDSIELEKNKTTYVDTLFIKGDQSDYIKTPEDLQIIQAIFTHYKLIEIKNAGHWTHVDNPVDLYQSLFDFFF